MITRDPIYLTKRDKQTPLQPARQKKGYQYHKRLSPKRRTFVPKRYTIIFKRPSGPPYPEQIRQVADIERSVSLQLIHFNLEFRP